MKILVHVITFYPIQSGGPIYTLYEHCKALKSKGFNILITSTISKNQQSEYGIKSDMWFDKEYGQVIYLSGLKRFYRNFNLAAFGKFDVVHLNSIFSWVSLLFFFTIYLRGQQNYLVATR